MLSGGELKDLYSKNFIVYEADTPRTYPEGHDLRKLTTRGYTPVFVFLDAGGKKVAETNGFRTEREGKALHQFITKKHYATQSWQAYLAAYK